MTAATHWKHNEGPKAHGNSCYIHTTPARSNTGVVGISFTIWREHPVFIVAPSRKKFRIDRLGRVEAWRQAVAHRAAHEAAVLAVQSQMPNSVLRTGKPRKRKKERDAL